MTKNINIYQKSDDMTVYSIKKSISILSILLLLTNVNGGGGGITLFKGISHYLTCYKNSSPLFSIFQNHFQIYISERQDPSYVVSDFVFVVFPIRFLLYLPLKRELFHAYQDW